MDKLNISTGTIVRTICLALALINMVLSAMGKPVLPIEDSTIEALVTSALTVPPAWPLGGRTTALPSRPSKRTTP